MNEIVVDPEDELEDGQEPDVIEQELQEAQSEPDLQKNHEALQKSYQHLERRMSQQGQELGELRQLSDTLIQGNTEKPDFFENPEEAVNQAVDGNTRLRDLEARTQGIQESAVRSELLRRHPDYPDIDKSIEFANWLSKSKLRQKSYADAAQNLDVDIADDLMVMYKESLKKQGVESERLEGERKDILKEVKSGSGSSGGATKKVFRRADLMKLQIEDPDRYAEMNNEILDAYAEGRVR